MPKPPTIRVATVQWASPGGTVPYPVDLVAWRITIVGSNVAAAKSFQFNGVTYSGGVVQLGGAYVDGRPINVRFVGWFVGNATGVYVEYVDPDI